MRQTMMRGLLVLGVICAPVQARAEPYVNPWAGVIFGNDDAAKGLWGFGASFGDAGGAVWGTETNIGLTPGFFGGDVENYVLDFMAGITVGPTYNDKTGHSVRPYGIGEIGVIRTSIDGDAATAKFTRNDFGYALGGGLAIEFNDHLGVRGDVRYFRAFSGDDALNSLNANLADFTYWRTAIGVILH